MKPSIPELRAGLVEACDDPDLFAIDLTPQQRDLLGQVEAADLLLFLLAIGRRGGKSLLGVVVLLWLCLLRPDLARYVRRRERRYAVVVATNARQSRLDVEQAWSLVEPSPLLRPFVESRTDDELGFRNRTSIVSFPCTARGSRGWPVMGLFMDEAAHFIDGDGNQAAPSVYRSLAPSVAQFGDEARIVVASSPYGVDGWFAETFESVRTGSLPGVAVQASTMEMRPGFAQGALELERRRDPESFRSEYGAEFVAAGGAFMDAARIEAVVAERGELDPCAVVEPEAAADLAFERDSSAVAVIGRDPDDDQRLRLAALRSWSPQHGRPLSFSAVLDEIADVALAYGCHRISIDQFSSVGASEHLRRRGLTVNVVPTTAQSKSAMYVDLKQRIYENELELYRHDGLLGELRRLETQTVPGRATVRSRRLGSSHGDLAAALALTAAQIRRRPLGWRHWADLGEIDGIADVALGATEVGW